MKKLNIFSLVVVLLCSALSLNAQVQTGASAQCPDSATAQASDYYLSHLYYFQCTELHDTVGPDAIACKFNEVGLIKLLEDGWCDFHWSGPSACIFDNIYVSEAGNYDIHWYQRNGGTVDLYVNGVSIKSYTAGKSDTVVMYRIALKTGEPNTIKIQKNDNWPQTLGISLSKSSAVIEKSFITFDKQQGVGGTDTVTATKGDAMPEIDVPTRADYVFEGYYSEITGGDQYYNPDGTSYKNWDKSDATFTLYAHWNDGSTGGDCPTAEQAISEDWYFSHMYDARCTELTNTWEKDNGAYIYLNAQSEKIKITENGEWMDFYWSDPSSIVFDSIYVSKEGFYDVEWYFRCDNIDGDPLNGSTSHIYVNDELFADQTVWQSTVEGLDTTTIVGVELYPDYPNTIKILKGNGWPLTRGIKLIGDATAVNNVEAAPYILIARSGQIELNRLKGTSDIVLYSMTGLKIYEAVSTETTHTIVIQPGAYLVDVNGCVKKAIVR